MKTLLLFIFALPLLVISCKTQQNSERNVGKKTFSQQRDVLSINSVNADYDQYSRAIFNYRLTEKIISDYGNGGQPYWFIEENGDSILKIDLFKNLPRSYQKLIDNSEDSLLLAINGLTPSSLIVPNSLRDLDAGFQFSNYIFKSSNQAALKAFGIVNSNLELNSTYIVIDYLQYKDVAIQKFPSIRYAVGIRAEIRVDETKVDSEIDIKSLSTLAAQVEIGKKSVNITIRTIGISGLESRMVIPNNTTFDVKTYSQFEQIIEFIRTLKDEPQDMVICPQRIPIVNTYSTSPEYSFFSRLEYMELLRKQANKLSRKERRNLKNSIDSIYVEMFSDELNRRLQMSKTQLYYDSLITNNSLNPIDFISTKSTRDELYNRLLKK
jgi:hypothetical protein